ncbi:hypothetical protein L9F63_008938, partial [Diploptera punctata]
FNVFNVFEISRKKSARIETDGNLKAQVQSSMLDVVAIRFLAIPEFLSWPTVY